MVLLLFNILLKIELHKLDYYDSSINNNNYRSDDFSDFFNCETKEELRDEDIIEIMFTDRKPDFSDEESLCHNHNSTTKNYNTCTTLVESLTSKTNHYDKNNDKNNIFNHNQQFTTSSIKINELYQLNNNPDENMQHDIYQLTESYTANDKLMFEKHNSEVEEASHLKHKKKRNQKKDETNVRVKKKLEKVIFNYKN